jgi:hypothetical protein
MLTSSSQWGKFHWGCRESAGAELSLEQHFLQRAAFVRQQALLFPQESRFSLQSCRHLLKEGELGICLTQLKLQSSGVSIEGRCSCLDVFVLQELRSCGTSRRCLCKRDKWRRGRKGLTSETASERSRMRSWSGCESEFQRGRVSPCDSGLSRPRGGARSNCSGVAPVAASQSAAPIEKISVFWLCLLNEKRRDRERWEAHLWSLLTLGIK